MTEHLDHALAQAVLASATRVVRARLLVEVEDLETLLAWADLHSGPAVGKWDAKVALGGQGTPRVRDHCLGEIAIARGTGVVATSNALAGTYRSTASGPSTPPSPASKPVTPTGWTPP